MQMSKVRKVKGLRRDHKNVDPAPDISPKKSPTQSPPKKLKSPSETSPNADSQPKRKKYKPVRIWDGEKFPQYSGASSSSSSSSDKLSSNSAHTPAQSPKAKLTIDTQHVPDMHTYKLEPVKKTSEPQPGRKSQLSKQTS
jgi:hypothetical protein